MTLLYSQGRPWATVEQGVLTSLTTGLQWNLEIPAGEGWDPDAEI